ncbi:Ankyrin repeat and SAM domain-containing protein 4B [Heterocephalus glaber]|uniref:Ankyrin repeat and SAM domain-containing protein 4B n=1 Tax=Heterocephalus glaber TaxID=10181 RepID=G5AY57_HETGA|nr:Ankyrin repeat and SAM domain-containing protein 4B [Heterocephalus glaber]
MSTRYHQAASDSYLELLKEATTRDLILSDEDGMTPTLLAAYHSNLQALEIICSRGGDPDRCDIWGNTLLHYAASNDHAHYVSFLISFGGNIFSLDNNLQSPLDAAASREQGECVALLDKAATTQKVINPKKVTRLKELAQKNARRQTKECEKLQEKHQNKMAHAYSKEESGSLSSFKRMSSRSSFSSASASSRPGSLSKGIKDPFKLKFKKNKDAAEQVGKEGRSGQRNVMEMFGEEEEDSLSGHFKGKLIFSAEEDQDVQHESILNHPGKEQQRLMKLRLMKKEENGLVSNLPWDEDEVEWEEDVVDSTPLEVSLQSLDLEEFLPIFMREPIDLEALLLCSDEDIQNIQIQLGPRKKVLNTINRRKQVLQQPGQLVDTSL